MDVCPDRQSAKVLMGLGEAVRRACDAVTLHGTEFGTVLGQRAIPKQLSSSSQDLAMQRIRQEARSRLGRKGGEKEEPHAIASMVSTSMSGDSEGRMALTRSALSLLVEAGVDVDAPQRTSLMSAIHHAVDKGHSEAVAFLLSDRVGCAVSPKDCNGWTPLHRCCGAVATLPLSLLPQQQDLERDPQRKVVGKDGTAWACINVAKALLAKGANIEEVTNGGRTVIHVLALWSGGCRNSKVVLRERSRRRAEDIQIRSMMPSTPLSVTLRTRSELLCTLLRLLYDHQNNRGPSQFTTEAGRQLLLKRDERCNTAFHYAASAADPHVLYCLLTLAAPTPPQPPAVHRSRHRWTRLQSRRRKKRGTRNDRYDDDEEEEEEELEENDEEIFASRLQHAYRLRRHLIKGILPLKTRSKSLGHSPRGPLIGARGGSPLHAAARAGALDCARLLAQWDADPFVWTHFVKAERKETTPSSSSLSSSSCSSSSPPLIGCLLSFENSTGKVAADVTSERQVRAVLTPRTGNIFCAAYSADLAAIRASITIAQQRRVEDIASVERVFQAFEKRRRQVRQSVDDRGVAVEEAINTTSGEGRRKGGEAHLQSALLLRASEEAETRLCQEESLSVSAAHAKRPWLPAGPCSRTAFSGMTPLMCVILGAAAHRGFRPGRSHIKSTAISAATGKGMKSRHYRAAALILTEAELEEEGRHSRQTAGGWSFTSKRDLYRDGGGGQAHAGRWIDGCTALHLCAMYDIPDIAELLLERDAQRRKKEGQHRSSKRKEEEAEQDDEKEREGMEGLPYQTYLNLPLQKRRDAFGNTVWHYAWAYQSNGVLNILVR